MKFKTRMQWGWFKAALLGTCLGLLIAPTVGSSLGITKEDPVISFFTGISFGPKTKVMINGNVVALAKSEEAGEAAFKAARLAYNAEGVKILDVNVSFEEVDKEKDAKAIKGMRVLKNEALSDEILASFDKYATQNKELAYTMRIDDYTVTVDSMENLVAVLEQTQGQYDTEDRFQVNLEATQSQNVTMYEIGVTEKGAAEDSKAEENGSSESQEVPTDENNNSESSETSSEEDGSGTPDEENAENGGVTMLPPTRVGLTGENADEQSISSEEQQPENAGDTDSQAGEVKEEAPEESTPEVNPAVAAQAVNDGIKFVGFSEKIQVTQTYVDKNLIKDKETTYNELTAKNDELSIYVVEPGDCLSVIAEKNNMTVDQIKELNPGIESDDNLYYDDRLNITVPTAAVQILVQKQETYEEKYNEDTVYEDDADMYIGESEVVQEGSQGTHIVTDLVTYKNDIESSREQLQENIEVAAVAQIVRRGTKSKPTYMYPVTNWNVTSNYGYRWGRLHAGTDVGIPVGTTVRASRAGKVITAGWVGGYGNCVMIDHGDGVWTVYGHLSEFSTSVGSYVNQGDQIALSGNTGRSTGPHLHFEIRVNGSSVDPTPYLQGTAN
ncbi:MAG: peptidoglycan DD-metalloendopeptidase family protein [Clostridiales bacterium]|nr:peptidoglycan DD-metalloendopeptidase family protein [Clostridiales bacterium]